MNETASDPHEASPVPTDLLMKSFAQRVSALASAAARVQEAQGRDAIHDLRVGARNLDAMLRTWAGLLRARPRRAALRVLRRLRRRLGSAREIEVHLSLLEPIAEERGEAVLGLVQRLRTRLSQRTARAAKRLRPRRLRTLVKRIEAAIASLGSGPPDALHALDRARAHLLERAAVARVAVALACAREDDWLLHQARLAIKKWRYALECVDGVGAGSDPRPVLRQLQEVLGAVQDRAALMAAVERHRRKRDRPGFEPLLAELRAGKQEAFARFQQLAPTLEALAARVPGQRVTRPPLQEPAAEPASSSTDERWERMAQWLLGKATER